MNCGHQSRNRKIPNVTPELVEHLNEWIRNHPQLVTSPISNGTFLIPDPDQPGKRIRVSKLLF